MASEKAEIQRPVRIQMRSLQQRHRRLRDRDGNSASQPMCRRNGPLLSALLRASNNVGSAELSALASGNAASGRSRLTMAW